MTRGRARTALWAPGPPTRGSVLGIAVSICPVMGRSSRRRHLRAAAPFGLGLLALAAAALPAQAAQRPPGPAPAAPKPRAVVATSHVPFRWHAAVKARGYDLRIARDRGFAKTMQTVHVRTAKAQVLLLPGRWYWKVRSTGAINSRWSNIRQIVVHPKGDAYPPSRPTALRVTAVAQDAVTVTFGASTDDRAVSGYELLASTGKVLARGAAAPLTATGIACATTYTLTVRALDAAGNASQASPVAHAKTHGCTDVLPPDAPANVRTLTVADTSVALAWDPAHDVDGTISRYAVYRNGVLLGQSQSTGFLARSLAPSTAYHFSVAAIDGGGHRSPESALDAVTQAPLPATGPAYAYMLASTSKSFEDLQRHYRQVATVSPTYYHVDRNLSISGQDDPLVTGWARQRGIAVEPRIETQDATTLHALLASPTNRHALVGRISALVATYGYDGVNIDFEAGPATDRANLVAFASELSQTLHAQGARLTMAVGAMTGPTLIGRNGFYDLGALAAVCDHLFVMAWDLHWAGSAAGPISDATWVQRVIAYLLTIPNASRFIIGTQLYGFDWPLGARATPLEWDDMSALSASLGAAVQWDAVAQEPFFTYTDASNIPHTAYFANAQSVQGRFGPARAAGLGVGFWRLGDEDQETWNIPSLTS
jgi:spore germination protein YaaH